MRNSLTRMVPGKILKPGFDGDGYAMVGISKNDDIGKFKYMKVHRLVAEAFIGPCPAGYYVIHGPKGNKDNSLSNIRYGTPAENALDRWRDGTVRKGELHWKSKLRQDEVVFIFDALQNGVDADVLARRYGVSRSTMYAIKSRVNWAWLTRDLGQ